MSTYRIIKKEQSIPEQQKSLLSSVVMLQNLHCWFCYENGFYFIYNLREDQKVYEGVVPKDIRQACSIQEKVIAFVSHADFSLNLFDLQTYQVDDSFQFQLPSKALTQIENVNKEETLLNVELFSMDDSNFLITNEPAIQDKRSFVLTCFNMGFMKAARSTPFTQMTIHPDGLFFVKVAPVDKRDLIVVSNINYQDAPLTFWIWNFLLKEQGYKKIVVDSLKLNGTIVDFSHWMQPQQIAFWINYSNSGKPRLIIYDLQIAQHNQNFNIQLQSQQQGTFQTLQTQMQPEDEKNIDEKNLLQQHQNQLQESPDGTLYTATVAEPPIFKAQEINQIELEMFGQEDWIFQEVVDIDVRTKKAIIIKIESEATKYVVFDCYSWTVDFTQLIDESEWNVVRTQNKKTFLEYNQDYSGEGGVYDDESNEEINNQSEQPHSSIEGLDKKINLRINFFTISVNGLLFILKQSNLIALYGQETAKDVIDMLIEKVNIQQ